MQSFTTQKIGEDDQTNHFSVIYTILSLVITKMDSFFFFFLRRPKWTVSKRKWQRIEYYENQISQKTHKVSNSQTDTSDIVKINTPKKLFLPPPQTLIILDSQKFNPKKRHKNTFCNRGELLSILTFNFSRNKPYPSQAVLWECTEDPTVIYFSHHLPPQDQLHIEKLHSSVC